MLHFSEQAEGDTLDLKKSKDESDKEDNDHCNVIFKKGDIWGTF